MHFKIWFQENDELKMQLTLKTTTNSRQDQWQSTLPQSAESPTICLFVYVVGIFSVSKHFIDTTLQYDLIRSLRNS